MIRIVSPQYSFVRFSDQHLTDPDWMERTLPGATLGFSLPVNAHDDLAFQFIAETDTEAEADTLCNDTGLNVLRITRVPGNTLGPTITHAAFNALVGVSDTGNNLGVNRLRIGPTEVIYYVPRIPTFDDEDTNEVQCGGCFQLAVSLSYTTDYASGVSNVFKYNCDDTDYTTVLNYYSIKDEAGFTYCNTNYKNRVRLPIYLTRPTYPEDETEFRTSNGSVNIIKANVRKVYEVVTDIWPEWAIEAFRAVFLHDDVETDESSVMPQHLPYKGEIVKDGPFEPQWTEWMNYPFASVKMKVAATPFVMKKNNCGECPDYSSMLVVEDIELGALSYDTPYVIDLQVAVTSSGCCDPLTFEIDYFQTTYISSIDMTTPITLFIVTAPSEPGEFNPPPFVRIKVNCGGVIKYFNINGEF